MGDATDEEDERERRARAQAKLPAALHRTFEALVDDDAVSAKIHAGEIAVDYDVIADLVRAGWRRVE